MLHEMMKWCCSENGTPQFEKMKQFMESCAKRQFGEKEPANMKECCSWIGTTSVDEQKK